MEKPNATQILPKNAIPKPVQFEILNPIGVTDTEIMEPVPRLEDLKHKRIGLFWNLKARGDVALNTVKAALKERFEGIEFSWFAIENSIALDPEGLKTIREQRNDAIISTTGD